MRIKPIAQQDLALALALVERVFMQFEAPDYTAEGIATFRTFIHDPEAVAALTFYGATVEEKLAGVLATRGNSHIALFFVEPCFQRQGIGRALFLAAKAACSTDLMTVNSSPYAVEIYRRLGFVPISSEQMKDGIRFTPMKYVIQEEFSI
jgi:GNAT superfamily N-acetyltransferase